jgi:CTP:molybdopterin cytidylyltransferase MocA
MIPAIILAGGASSRMGRPKALLSVADGDLFVTRIVRTLVDAGLQDVVVVSGFEHEAIVAAVESAGASVRPRVVRNHDPGRGQLSSLWCGLDAAVDADTPAVLMTLVDVPMISAATVAAVLQRWRETRAPIVRPLFQRRHGHPVIFDRSVLGELRAAPLDQGARVVVHAHLREAVDVPVDDPGCIVDVDTSDDYRRLFS